MDRRAWANGAAAFARRTPGGSGAGVRKTSPGRWAIGPCSWADAVRPTAGTRARRCSEVLVSGAFRVMRVRMRLSMLTGLVVSTLIVAAGCSSSGDSTGDSANTGADDASGAGGSGTDTSGSGGDATEDNGTGGTGDTGDTGAAGSNDRYAAPGEDAVVTLFDARVFSNQTTKISQDSVVTFPEEGTYESIILKLKLACPTGGCDPWDRYATLGIVDPSEPDDNDNNLIEFARYITPYGVGGEWEFDLTALRPLLSGEQTVRGFISTWSKGWEVTAKVEFKGGTPEHVPVYVVPAWKLKYVVLGDPGKLVSVAVPPASVTLPEGASSLGLHTIITGHGQGNALNCAEFCRQEHIVRVAETPHANLIWRDDCAENPVSPQHGTWQHNRAGWCPGADVLPWAFDITDSVSADVLAGTAPLELAYFVGENYENTCRPGAVPEGEPCRGCARGTSCEYDNAGHTEPYYKFSALVVGYR